MSQFIGLHMRVVLREPPGHLLTGTVSDVQAGISLTLTNVFLAATREWVPLIRIDALNIADLSEVHGDGPETKPPAPATTYASQQSPRQRLAQQLPTKPVQPAFVDPAILSLGRRPKSAASGKAKNPPEKEVDETDPAAQPGVLYGIHVGRQSFDSGDEHTIVASVKDLKIDPVVVPKDVPSNKPRPPKEVPVSTQTQQQQQQQQQQKKKARRHPKAHKDHLGEPQVAIQTQGHGKGWRQTPILQSNASFQPFTSLKRNTKGVKSLMDNGFASEDVTEEMGDFDFENNLAKFDKHKIFDQMRKEDQVDDASRLVAHNRRPKPGTAGGKNLHYTENVLDTPPNTATPSADYWNSEADVGANGSERLSGREPKNGAQGGRRPDSKTPGGNRSQSRKAGTAAVGSQPLSRVNSSLRYQASRRSSPTTGHRSTDYEQQQQQPGLYLVPSNRRVETISTLQMLNIENIAANEVGFTEALMAENAGRGIAEVAVIALSDPAMKVRFEMVVAGASSDISLRSSTIVILAGNNKSGTRALAAGRHLRNKNFDVVVCLVGIERERDLLEDLRRQIQLYRNFGGKVLSKNDFFEYLRKGSGAASGLPISLIIDALLGLTMSFEELRVGDQASVYELMEWANRNEAFVLAVDVPSGIDPTSGKVAVIDGGHLFVKPRYVVAIGAPKKGLLEAVTPPPHDDSGLSSDIGHEDVWRLFIADLGLGSSIWRKSGTKIRRGIEFDGKWVLEMKYRGLEETEEDD
ncbi:YjeF-related protein N-terminus domain-containing protein [Trichoderma novae-zelandiae]